MGVIQKETIKGSTWSYIGAIIGFVNVGLLFPKIFSTSEIGLLNVVVAISALFSQISSLGVNSAIARLFPYFNSDNRNKFGFLTLSVIVTTLGFVLSLGIGLVFKDWITETNNDDIGLLDKYAFYLIPMTFFTLFFNLLDTYNKMLRDITSGIFLKEFLLRAINFVSIFLFFFGIVSFDIFVFLYVASFFVPLAGIIVILLKRGNFSLRLKGFMLSPTMKKEIILVSAFGILAGFSGIVIDFLDKFLVGKYLGLSDAGIYSIMFLIGGMILLPFRALNKISSTLIAECWKDNDLKTIETIHKRSSLNQFMFGIFLFGLIVLNLSNIFDFFPNGYEKGKWVIIVISFSNVMIMLSGVSYVIISAAKYYWYMTLLMGIQIVLVVTCNILLIPTLGMVGAALASLVSVVFIRAGSIVIVGIKSKIWPFTPKHITLLLVSAISFSACFIIPKFSSFYVDAIVRSFSFTLVFTVLTMKFEISDEARSLYDKVVKRVFQSL